MNIRLHAINSNNEPPNGEQKEETMIDAEMIKKLVRPVVAAMPAYVPGRTVEQASKENGGIEMIKLGSNESQVGPSPMAIKAMVDVAAGSNTYPNPVAGDLGEALADYFGVEPKNVVCGNGSSAVLDAICRAYVGKDDEVLYCMPSFQIYEMFTEEMEGKPVVLPLDAELKFDLEAMKANITDKTKLVMICNPNNPTGSFLNSKELSDFIKSLPSHVICVIDEAYIEFATDPECASMLPLINDYNVVIVRTFSKIWGLAGARVGYAIANEEIAKYIRSCIVTFNVNKMVIAGAMASLKDKEFLQMSWEVNKEGKEYLTEEMKKFGWKVWPTQSNFIYVTETSMDAATIAKEMEKRGIIIRGNMGFLRITIGTMDQNKKMVAAFKELLGK